MAGPPILILALLGCDAGPTDNQIHAKVLAAPLAEVEVIDCKGIDDAELRGECQLYAAFTVGSQRDEDLDARCAEVEGVWRDECYFLAAEDLRRRKRDLAGSGALCKKSGRFVDDCSQHLWQSPVKVIVDRHLRSLDLVAALEEATPLYCEWASILGEDSDMSTRFWQKLFGGFFEHRASLDPARCEVLEGPALEHCRAAVAQVYLRRIHMLSTAEPQLLCVDDPTVESMSHNPNLQAVPDELLQRVLDEQHHWACTLGEGGLPPMGAELLSVDEPPVDCSG